MGESRAPIELPVQVPEEIAGLLSRRDILKRATVLALGGLVLSALPAADRILSAGRARGGGGQPRRRHAAGGRGHADPGPPGQLTDLGNEIHPKAIAGVHHEPGAVETDALVLFHSPLIGFDRSSRRSWPSWRRARCCAAGSSST